MPRSRIIFLAILVVFVIAAILIGVVRPQIEQNNAAQGTQVALENVTTIRVNFGTEKQRWFSDAVMRFEQANPNINVELNGQGSMASYQALSQITLDRATFDGGKPIPTLWSPASQIQVNLLNGDMQSPSKLGRDLAINCRQLVLSPLAIMIWEDRAKVLEAKYKDQGGITFQNLYNALSDPAIVGRWGNLGGDPNWGFIKLGYTDPRESNSGTMMLMALANNYYGTTKAIQSSQAVDQQFAKFLTAVSNAVSQPSRSSSGILMDDFIAKGPAAYDIVIVYEALALEHFQNAVGRHNQTLRIIYPLYNLYSDHPQCLIDHPSITPEQRAAASKFQEFLLSQDVQKLALSYGFRPADLGIPIFGANTDFDKPEIRAAGISANVGQEIVIPDGNTINNLLRVWREGYQG